jgi:DNA modification methylase
MEPVRIGDATLYCGDARDVLPMLGYVDVVLTDPPYSSGRSEIEFAATGNVAVCLHLASEKAPTMMVFGTSSGRGIEFIRSSIRGLKHTRVLVWHRNYVNSPAAGPWRWDVVFIHVFGRGAFGRPGVSSLISTNGTQALANEVGHKAPVPLEVMDWLYLPFAPGTVLDPFMGSGSTLLAAIRRGGKCIGIEADATSFDIACDRIRRAYEQPRLDLPEPERAKQGELL